MGKKKKGKQNVIVNGNCKSVGVVLDGKNNYIVAYRANSAGHICYPLKFRKDAEFPIRFTSFEVARITAETVLGRDKGKIVFKVTIDGNEYDLADAYFTNGYFQLFDPKNGTKYYIKEVSEQRVRWIGYIGVDNGFRDRKDKKYGIPRSKELFEAIENAAQQSLLSNADNSIGKIHKISNREYVFDIRNSTAKIHVMSNAKIMDLNQKRKEEGKRCVQFNKSVDKFLTVYVYITSDQNEMKFLDSKDKALKVMEELVSTIYYMDQPKFDTIEWMEVPFSGYIIDD